MVEVLLKIGAIALYPFGVAGLTLWGMCHYAPYSAMGKWLVLQIFLQ